MAQLTDLVAWLRARFGRERAPNLFRDGPQEVRALALALEPDDVPDDVGADALFLHRAFGLGERFPGLGVLASHDGFDAHLTTGENLVLARQLGWQDVQPFKWEGRIIGLTATPPQHSWRAVQDALTREFGGRDAALEPQDEFHTRLALMSAMKPELLGAVHQQGASIYVTGQLRVSAQLRARELGLGVIALGHRRSELWGLRQLAREIEDAFPEVRASVCEG